MSIYIIAITMFLIGVLVSSLFFVRARCEVANKNPEQQMIEKINTLSARISVLENKKMGKIEMVEITDAVKLIMKEHQEIRDIVSKFSLDFNTTVTRLIASFRPLKSKDRKSA